MTRNVTPGGFFEALADHLDSTASGAQIQDPEQYRLYRLCPCGTCAGTGKRTSSLALPKSTTVRCPDCRGEGKSLDLVATCGTPEAVGVALVTLGLEGEWDECPIGIMHRPEGQTGKWLVRPWLPSARNVSDAGRTLARSKNTTH